MKRTRRTRLIPKTEFRKNSDAIRHKVGEILEELIELYEKTDPALGKKSERFKYSRALKTLSLCNRITENFSSWAENQIFGELHFRNMGLKNHTADSHLNERGNYKVYQHRDLIYMKPLRLDAERYREFIATVLDAYSGPFRNNWKKSLSKELIALNEGEAQFITTPSDKGGQGRSYTLRFLRFISVAYVYYFVGKGMAKHKALEHVGSIVGASPETLRDWDKNILPQFGSRKHIHAIALLIGKHRGLPTAMGYIEEDNDLPSIENIAIDAHERGDTEMIHLTRQALQFEYHFREHPLDTIASKMQSAKRNEPPASPA
jgi:hypothetical protein